MSHRAPALVFLSVAALTTAAAAAGIPDVHQDSVRLTRTASAFAAPDGLLTLGVRGGRYHPRQITDYGLPDYDVWQWELSAEWDALPGLALRYDQRLRTWSNWSVGQPASGSGLADGQLDAFVAAPGLPDWVGLSLWTGTSIPTGVPQLGEGAASPHAAAILGVRLWRQSQLPELRLHAMYGRRWNGNEDQGYGVGLGPGPQPWWPRYPDAATAGGAGKNDFTLWSVALEFRRNSTAFWIEYFAAELAATPAVAPREDDTSLDAGVRWGLAEGWAVSLNYIVPLFQDWLWNEYKPELPDHVMSLGISRQFSLGGSDRDGDGIPDRKDRCPGEPEDQDGFADEDGCPDNDNDGDGIADAQDDCPNAAEDFDGFQDDDGCPDPDNDNDGILDKRDACPNEPETVNGYKDADGCPDVIRDRDGDGVPDEDDLCPDSPEDRDGFEDADGCPDPDNDLDGIADGQDQCPDQAEDYDGDRDGDGCPDTDK